MIHWRWEQERGESLPYVLFCRAGDEVRGLDLEQCRER